MRKRHATTPKPIVEPAEPFRQRLTSFSLTYNHGIKIA
jgi:hypothetical protein